MSDIKELRQNIERLNKSTTVALKNQSYELIQKNIVTIESEFEAARKELSSKNEVLEQVKRQNLILEQDYSILNVRVRELLKEKAEVEKKLEQLSRTRPHLSSANLVKAFRDSLEQMDESMNTGSSRVSYSVSSMNIKLRTNIAVQDNELRFQLPKADDVIPADNLSQVEFTIKPSFKEPVFSGYVDVPDVLGLDIDAAVSILKDAGFVQGEVIEKDSSLVQGTVLSQIPSGSSVAKPGDAVDMVMSKIMSVAVPNVVGMTQEAAKKTLETGKLTLGKVTEQADSSKSGTVLRQSVPSGEYVGVGAVIDIVVASSMVVFAAVSGKEAAGTRPVIAGAVKDVKTVSSNNPSSKVISTRKSISGKV
ncbi:PASTA domain-containing protein [Methanolobus psychrotolerans]|uniref:PASTA domain-containing protein n=1 Tax=Methanolobus psychrotolerans TaxID=1874706 RepID=UPI0013ED2616|nr:PASTA domain-containing protein [Methanolobus psychrotolerans]